MVLFKVEFKPPNRDLRLLYPSAEVDPGTKIINMISMKRIFHIQINIKKGTFLNGSKH